MTQTEPHVVPHFGRVCSTGRLRGQLVQHVHCRHLSCSYQTYKPRVRGTSARIALCWYQQQQGQEHHYCTMQLPTPKQVSPRPSARRQTASPQPCGRSKPSSNTVRGSSISLPIPSSRALTPAPTVLSDVFEIVADGNADVLAEMIAFSGAEHMAELRSKKQEDFGQNLLHCAVASGQLTTLQVLLQHKNFDPNQARSSENTYSTSTSLYCCIVRQRALNLPNIKYFVLAVRFSVKSEKHQVVPVTPRLLLPLLYEALIGAPIIADD